MTGLCVTRLNHTMGSPGDDRDLSSGGIVAAGAVVLLGIIVGVAYPQVASSATYSPSSPRPHSPLLQEPCGSGYAPPSPAELAGGTSPTPPQKQYQPVASCIGPNDVVSEAMTGSRPFAAGSPHYHHHSAAGLLNGGSPFIKSGNRWQQRATSHQIRRPGPAVGAGIGSRASSSSTVVVDSVVATSRTEWKLRATKGPAPVSLRSTGCQSTTNGCSSHNRGGIIT
ncbi:hypothetical protein VTK26DRAFT_6274 [Humicola hyalothermophila]